MKAIKKDLFKRQLVEMYWFERIRIKSIRHNQNILGKESLLLNLNILLSTLCGQTTVIRNRCIESGHGRNVLTHYKISGLFVRELALKSILPNIYKMSW